MPVRAIAVSKDEKLIGSRNGLFYIDEKKQRFKSFKVPELRSNMILCKTHVLSGMELILSLLFKNQIKSTWKD